LGYSVRCDVSVTIGFGAELLMSEERERLSWPQFGTAVRDLARRVSDNRYEPDLILSIARGGLLVGAALGYALDVKNTWTMNVEFYTGIDERLDVPMLLPPVPDLVDLESSRMLIADDVADTGETLRLVKDFCAGKVGEVRCAVLYEKSRSVVKSEYVWRSTDLWIDFPWSAQSPVVPAKPDPYRSSVIRTPSSSRESSR
jgi:hypoxanthine phosphoribosyltransferase